MKRCFSSSSSTAVTSFGGSKKIQVFAVGLLAGGAGSWAGMGGAFIALPFLTSRIFALPQHLASGTTSVVALCTSLGSCVAYALKAEDLEVVKKKKKKKKKKEDDEEEEEEKSVLRRVLKGEISQIGNISTPVAVGISFSASIFAVVGAIISKKLSAKALTVIQGVALIAIAPLISYREDIVQLYRSILDEKHSSSSSSSSIEVSFQELLEKSLKIGVFTGFYAGLLGVGGGAIMVPALCLCTDLNYKTVLGTSMAAMLPTALASM